MGEMTCGVCGKKVRNKPILGTLHVCLSDREVIEREWLRWQMDMQKRALAAHRTRIDSPG